MRAFDQWPSNTAYNLRILSLGFLVSETPVVEIAGAGTQVCRKPEPTQVWHEAPRGDFVDGSPDLDQVRIESEKRQDVHGSFDRTFQPEEEGHPGQVQAELDRVQRRAVLGEPDGLDRVERGEAVVDRTVRSVPHQAVQQGPYRAEDNRRGTQGRLLDGEIRLLRLGCLGTAGWSAKRFGGEGGRKGGGLRRVP